MARLTGYGQFCPLAKASEVFAERWTPLILREVMIGSTRFSDIQRGVPLISRSLLSKRLQDLVRAGVLQRVDSGKGYDEYLMTAAGEDLRPIIFQLGAWGKQWTRRELPAGDLDVSLLMWDMRRRVNRSGLPERRVVVQFQYRDAPIHRRRWWLVLNRDDIDLCVVDPGLEADVTVRTDVRTMVGIWMGDLSFGAALQGRALEIEGPAEMRTRFPAWLLLSHFAEIDRRVD
ncbi:MAG: transcriptional regulator [Chthonomonadales bacterium]|nr:transcriptional regulator [Chthonomonadales bacterium]